jgi:putative transposase
MSYWQKVTYSSTSMTLSYNRGYKIAEDSVNLTTFSHGRKTYKICNYPYAKQFFRSLWKFEDSKVMKDNNEYYFHLTVSRELPDKKIEEASTFMGLDLGINFLAVASTNNKKCKFFAGG